MNNSKHIQLLMVATPATPRVDVLTGISVPGIVRCFIAVTR
jgi:hypothetical protein